MSKVLFEKIGRIGRVTLNRPEVLNAIDDEVPALLSKAMAAANLDSDVHVIILSGNGPAFCAGYDLTFYAEGAGSGQASQEMPCLHVAQHRAHHVGVVLAQAGDLQGARLLRGQWHRYGPVQ